MRGGSGSFASCGVSHALAGAAFRFPHDCKLQIRMSNLQSSATNYNSGGSKVSNYTIEELIARWKREELTIEQVIGQILLLLKEQDRRLREAVTQAHARREQ
jgi:hypothetical protein